MPYRDGTGPNGQGAATGRGLGPCANARPRSGLGLGCRRGCENRALRQRNIIGDTDDRQALIAEKEKLEIRLEATKKRLEEK